MKRFNVFIVLIVVSLSLSACGGSGGGSGGSVASAGDPLIGAYFMSGTVIATGDFVYARAAIEPGNKITYVEAISAQSNPSNIVYRKKYGIYSKHGHILTITWEYETCDPTLTETVMVNGLDPSDRIFVTMGPNTYQMLNEIKWTPNIDFANSFFVMTEDVNCNLMD